MNKIHRATQIATSPELIREQYTYLRFGPVPTEPELTYPASPWHLALDRWATAWCNICGWRAVSFLGPAHVEAQLCRVCGSNARDRFLFWCFIQRRSKQDRLRVMETSPRMGEPYRQAMSRWFTYTASDFDEHAHRAAVRLDLQDIDLPDESIDVLLTPHVLEHVPDTNRALAEIHRILAPGGVMLLQIPLLQGVTAVPAQPEFHADDTPVFWRFGLDLTERLRSFGFVTSLLCTEPWCGTVSAGTRTWPETEGEFDVVDLLRHSRVDDLVPVIDADGAQRLGLCQPYQFLVFECSKPVAASS